MTKPDRADFPEQLLRAVARMERWGLDGLVVKAAMGRIDRLEDFPGQWRSEGDSWDERSRAALDRGHIITAAQWARQAYYCYRMTDFYYTWDCQEKLDAYDAGLEAHRRAVAHGSGPRLREVAIPFEGSELPGHLVLPATAAPDRIVPAVLFIYGADGNKEEHYWATAAHLAERGMAVLVADGPGHGWSRRKLGLTSIPDYERFGSRCVDVLADQPETDADRLALMGSSVGGYYAPRVFAADKRLRACLINSALFRVVEGLWDRFPSIRTQLTYSLGIADDDEARAALEAFRLDGVIQSLDRPLCVYHGAEDRMIPPSEAIELCEAAGDAAELVMWQGAGHNLGSVRLDSHPRMWDWLSDCLENDQSSLVDADPAA